MTNIILKADDGGSPSIINALFVIGYLISAHPLTGVTDRPTALLPPPPTTTTMQHKLFHFIDVLKFKELF